MVWVKMCQDQVINPDGIYPSLVKPGNRISNTINQQGALFRFNNEMGILMELIWNCTRGDLKK